jgi:hypothetical protein
MQMAIYASLTFLALYLWIKEKADAYFWTAFFSCTFAIWTKNEGSIVMLGFVTMLCIYMLRSLKKGGDTKYFYKQIFIAAGIVLTLFAAWFIFKKSLSLSNVIFNDKTFDNYNFAEIFKRAGLIIYEYQRQAFGIKYWNLAWISFIFFICADFRRLFCEENLYIVTPIFIILSGYTIIYFITPLDIRWHLRYSASRLLLHMLPLVIFYVALETKSMYYNLSKGK